MQRSSNGSTMQLRHLNTLTQPATGEGGDGVKMSKVMAVAWAPNNRKLAVCTVRYKEAPETAMKAQTALLMQCEHIHNIWVCSTRRLVCSCM